MQKKKKIDPSEYNLIQELKAQTNHGPMVEVNSVDKYKIMIIGRGEQLFYQQEDRALLCDIQVRNDLIYQNSIAWWDNGNAVTESEKSIILERLINYFKIFQKSGVKLV
ncbi:hypothetical protein [Fibrella arboris]|uniref:hypothetical protein n=1 Tax=Fibrella arboris TaxID=3242486 RepID=UPI003520061E